MKNKTAYYDTNICGWLKLTMDEKHRVLAAVFVAKPGKQRALPPDLKLALDRYTNEGKKLPKSLYKEPAAGTSFQQAVWRAIAAVPYGQTITYTELAKNIDRPNAVRAVGSACGQNPLALFIPCHRVTSVRGDIVNYAWGSKRKQALLRHENRL